MENQEHHEFNEDAAFDEAAKSLETGELTADSLPSDAEKTEKDKPDQLESEPEQQEKVEQDDLPDWLQSATDEVKENFRKLQADNQRYQHQARSQNGRVGALTKKYQQAQAEIERLKQEHSYAKPQLNDELKALEDDYPEFAKMFRKFAEHQDRQLAEYTRPLEQLAQAEMQDLAQQQLENSINYVSQIVPDAEQILNNPHFATWLQRQPVGIQALFNSDEVDDAIYLLSEYKKNISANEVRKAKQNQQLSVLSLPSGRTVPKGGEEVDEDVYFNQIAAQLDKQRSRY